MRMSFSMRLTVPNAATCLPGWAMEHCFCLEVRVRIGPGRRHGHGCRSRAPIPQSSRHPLGLSCSRTDLARKNFAAARQLLEDVIQKAPQFLTAHVILSHVLLQSGDERAAEPQLRRIVAIDPGQAESWRNLAVLYRRSRRLREAIAAAKAGCLYCPQIGRASC